MTFLVLRPVMQLDLDDNIIAEFSSSKTAAKQFGGKNKDINKIRWACQISRTNGERRVKKSQTVAFGYKWKYKEDI